MKSESHLNLYAPERHARRRTLEALPLMSFCSWSALDFMTLGMGAVLILCLLGAVIEGMSWVILPGAVTVLFAVASTQTRWGRLQRARLQRVARGRGARGDGGCTDGSDGGIVQLPKRHGDTRRAG